MSRTINADAVEAALARMLDVASDRAQLQSVRLSIVKRQIVTLQRHIDQQATNQEVGS